MPTLDRAELDELRLYLDLGRRLGMLHAQMDRGTVKSATLRYRGEVAHKNTRLITASFAAGWMEAGPRGAGQPRQRRGPGQGARDHDRRGEDDRPRRLRHDDPDRGRRPTQKTYVAAGTLFGKEFIRLVRLGPYRLDAHLDGKLLIFTHRDVPGLIGFIGTTFGRHNVNIAQMNVGREQPGGEAIGVVNLDSVPSEAALDEVRRASRHPQRQPDQAPRGRARRRPGWQCRHHAERDSR